MGFGADYNSHEVLTAFLLVIGAGAATGIGAAVVFVPRLVEHTSKKALAASLGLAAGVMIYISLVDIYQKAITGFERAGHGSDHAFVYATLGFFGGVLLMKAIDYFISVLLGNKHLPDMVHFFSKEQTSVSEASSEDNHQRCSSQREDDDEDEEAGICSAEERQTEDTTDHKKLVHMGAAAAFAIFLHNLPEGAVTFASYMEDANVGAVLAVAIGIHNIPEGLCVAMPIYFATQNRWKAFLWGILSGVSEPFGALIAYFVLGGSFSGNTNGILFSVLAGIMTMLSLDELLPSAHRYDPENQVVTSFLVLGMFAVGMSLVMFSL